MILVYVLFQNLERLGIRFKSDELSMWVASLEIQNAHSDVCPTVNDERRNRFAGKNVLVYLKDLNPEFLELLFVDVRDGEAIPRGCLQRHTLHVRIQNLL